jgi:hypothetical protein
MNADNFGPVLVRHGTPFFQTENQDRVDRAMNSGETRDYWVGRFGSAGPLAQLPLKAHEFFT